MNRRWLCAIALLIVPDGLAGQARSNRDTIEVRADTASSRPRFVLPELRATATSARGPYGVQPLDGRAAALRGESLSDWARRLPGVQVRSRGPGGPETLSIRGSRAQDVRVTLDGIPLNDPLTGAADLSLVPTATIETGSLTSGAGASAGWGGTAGSLALRSRAAPPGIRLRGLAGSYGHLVTDLEAGVAGAAGSASLFARTAGVRNDFAFENRILPDGPIERRANADAETWHILGRAALEAVPVTMLVRADGVERGAPGRMGNTLWDAARWHERRTSVSLGWSPTGNRAAAALGWSSTHQRYRDDRIDREDAVAASQLVATGSVSGPFGIDLEWSGTWARVDGGRIESRTRWSGGVRGDRAFSVGAATVHSGLLVDAADEGIALSPSLGVGVELGRGWRVLGRASQARRLPTFADLYLRPGLGVLPNPDLRAEHVTLDAEVGLTWAGPTLSARSTLFRRHTKDPIIWLPSVISLWTPDNLGELNATGVELAAAATPGGGWRVEAGATWQTSAVDFADGASSPLPYEPRLSGSLTVEHEIATRAVSASVTVVGSRRTNLFGPHLIDAYALLSIRGRQTFHLVGLKGELEAGIVNALDATYERVELFPEPGRRFEIGLSIATGRRARLPSTRPSQSLPNAAECAGRTSDQPTDAGRSHTTSGL